MAALLRTKQNLAEADAIGAASEAKMKEQTSRMQRMNGDMDQVGANLNVTDRLIGTMAKGWVATAISSFNPFGGSTAEEPAEPKLDVDTRRPALMEGWLSKRGPLYGYAWQRRWCVLHANGLLVFSDERKAERKAEVEVKAVTKASSFQKANAPGEAVKHRGEKPFGFVVDSDPGAGKDRRLFYFDAENALELKRWTQAFEQATKQLRKEAGDPDLDVRGLKPSSSEPMAEINSMLDGLHERALNLGSEAKVQAKLVSDLSQKVDSADDRMQKQTGRMRKL